MDQTKRVSNKSDNEIHIVDPVAAEAAYAQFLKESGVSHALTSVKDTAKLASELLIQRTSGLHQPTPELSLINFESDDSDWVILDDIPFYSLCEHHFVPFFGTVKIEYMPHRSIAGLGGFIRLVDHFSKQPQLQERLTQQIGRSLCEQLQPKALHITLKARQMCVELRGQPAICVETRFSYENKYELVQK